MSLWKNIVKRLGIRQSMANANAINPPPPASAAMPTTPPAPDPLPITNPLPIFVDSVFSFNATNIPETRNWQTIDGLRLVPDLMGGARSRQDVAQAETIIRGALTDYSDYHFVHAWHGTILIERERIDEARQAYMDGIQISREKHYLCKELGMLEYKRGTLKEAVRWWIRGVLLQISTGSVDDAYAFLYLAYVARVLGESSSSTRLMDASAQSDYGVIDLSREAKDRIANKVLSEGDSEIIGAIRSLTLNHWFQDASVNEELTQATYEPDLRQPQFFQDVWNGDVTKVEVWLRDNPGLVSSRDEDGRTAIHLVEFGDCEGVVELLVDYKADVNARDTKGNTALSLAVGNRNKNLASLLIKCGANVNSKNNYGCTPLHAARSVGVVELLLSSGATVNSTDLSGETPLHKLATSRDVDDLATADLLIANGVDVNAENNKKQSPLKVAEQWERTGMVELLRKHESR